MRIGELSRRTGVSPRSLRYYEEQGLLASTRTVGGHREYGPLAPERVDRIQCLFAAGLSSATIYELLPCIYAQERGEPAPDLLDHLCEERARIAASLDRLERTLVALDGVIDNSRPSPTIAPGGARRG
ncbi:MerR family transcriptional regulator [Nocardiopsis sp. NRRL B-16309]|uniref:MerR family transcriptional regulator n=1 Tax=Nocardiopsis sp. NRRL B-16309 TaxID=1519494 RepID=UPI0006AF5212|nr:MerR family transcriptional regulator [Nocardiopsis sp. NRRL B-16309]KOX08821.1 MerR family transcriptional regulator [Nocardiopsis sp. NRRL B-16309]